jgi:hypothetical protein
MPACDFMTGRLINSPRRVARNGIKRDVLSYLWTPTSGDGTRTHMLPRDIQGIGFKTADAIAMKLGNRDPSSL